jgi:uncharacterized membrane protein YeaQ/YmgE (transglycosylase-associated protein family)
MKLVEFILVGLIAGWMIGKIRRGRGYGLIGNLIIGTIGSFIGWFLMGFLKLQSPNVFVEIAMAVVGAVVFFLLVGILRFKRKRKDEEDED